MQAFNWLAAWLLFIVLIIGITRTKTGNTAVYYLAWLAVMFLVITHYKDITNILQAGGIVPQTTS